MFKYFKGASCLMFIASLAACSNFSDSKWPVETSPKVLAQSQAASNKISLNKDWKFIKVNNQDESNFHLTKYSVQHWENASLPHTANIEPLVVNDQWQGISWYRKELNVPSHLAHKKLFIEFEAAMNRSKIWINEQLVSDTQGGYLPIVIDATKYLNVGKNNTIAIRLDNRDNAVTGPKPLKILDFNMYGGIYRNAWLTYKNAIYITNANLVDEVADGIFITTPKVSESLSTVQIKTHVQNSSTENQRVILKQQIFGDGKLIAEEASNPIQIVKGSAHHFQQKIRVEQAKLWSPDSPYLYQLKTQVIVDGNVLDTQTSRFGIRQFEFKAQTLYLNGEKIFLRGVNRHQEYPFVGYALSDNAQYRDALKIKQAGFNYVRLSHYPHSPAFMRACDELGLIVLDAILGWQYYSETEAFKNHTYNTAKQLIRRDRNHPSVLGWEVSLNETLMPIEYMEEMHRIVHSEYPGDNVYSAGWMDDVYDIYLQARQHKIKHKGMHNENNKPYMVSEYGDWEYYSNNAGLNQHNMSKDLRFMTSSRQLRSYGEARLLQQAYNVQEAHNDNFETPAYGDAYWVMFDYNRGYHDEIESSGLMDIFRIPKFAYYFYQSQQSAEKLPMVHIASYWNKQSPLDVKVFSNGDTVKLFLNDNLVATKQSDTGKNTQNLVHPPFTFAMNKFTPGELKAVAYKNGKKIAEHSVKTPNKATHLKAWIDESGKAPTAGQNDTIFMYIAAIDDNGTIVPEFNQNIDLQLYGDVKLINPDSIIAEAGIATAVIQIGEKTGTIKVTATTKGLENGDLSFKVK